MRSRSARWAGRRLRTSSCRAPSSIRNSGVATTASPRRTTRRCRTAWNSRSGRDARGLRSRAAARRTPASGSRAMRLWSLHPRHLDAKGLVALWREALLARAVLRGKTRGYKFHPQLERFRERDDPVALVDAYLHCVLSEAQERGYRFDRRKIGRAAKVRRLPVRSGQIAHEWKRLLSKLHVRDRARWTRERGSEPQCHPCFYVVPGAIERWERTGEKERAPRARI